MTQASNVLPFPDPPGKTIPVDAAGPFTFAMLAYTDIIGGDDLNLTYRQETALVDPDAALEDDCLVVLQFAKGKPHMSQWWRTGKDHSGRFVPAGDRRECFALDIGLRYAASEELRILRILGRVVGEPRRLR